MPQNPGDRVEAEPIRNHKKCQASYLTDELALRAEGSRNSGQSTLSITATEPAQLPAPANSKSYA